MDTELDMANPTTHHIHQHSIAFTFPFKRAKRGWVPWPLLSPTKRFQIVKLGCTSQKIGTFAKEQARVFSYAQFLVIALRVCLLHNMYQVWGKKFAEAFATFTGGIGKKAKFLWLGGRKRKETAWNPPRQSDQLKNWNYRKAVLAAEGCD